METSIYSSALVLEALKQAGEVDRLKAELAGYTNLDGWKLVVGKYIEDKVGSNNVTMWADQRNLPDVSRVFIEAGDGTDFYVVEICDDASLRLVNSTYTGFNNAGFNLLPNVREHIDVSCIENPNEFLRAFQRECLKYFSTLFDLVHDKLNGDPTEFDSSENLKRSYKFLRNGEWEQHNKSDGAEALKSNLINVMNYMKTDQFINSDAAEHLKLRYWGENPHEPTYQNKFEVYYNGMLLSGEAYDDDLSGTIALYTLKNHEKFSIDNGTKDEFIVAHFGDSELMKISSSFKFDNSSISRIEALIRLGIPLDEVDKRSTRYISEIKLYKGNVDVIVKLVEQAKEWINPQSLINLRSPDERILNCTVDALMSQRSLISNQAYSNLLGAIGDDSELMKYLGKAQSDELASDLSDLMSFEPIEENQTIKPIKNSLSL